ncbi:hypothetical protein [Marinithermus hydrothermalis]|uniref:Uncharacterized protein n=1 Tax=Marinithermus hydrothermalis (strain DSM 14884 / JCM 11576 / T1) TaxID=869210 RepID=F2NLS9_MARHT|nr:hypothetical protein [Marinithermus hydrothermalis]AEB10909.1 hypothetical protein Marky_0146 [Marinithermus hydrothermalis DSM 14884]
MNARLAWLIPLVVLTLGGVWIQTSWARYQRLVAEAQALEARRDALSAALLPPAQRARPLPPARLNELYHVILQTLEASGATLNAFTPSPPQLHLTLEGTYPEVVRFLEALPTLDYPVWVERYTLTPLTPRGDRLTLELELGVRLEDAPLEEEEP